MSKLAHAAVSPFAPARVRKEAAADSAPHLVLLTELLTDNFVARHTRFTSCEALIRAAEQQACRRDGLGLCFGHDWDVFIRSVSRHPDWPALLGEACAEWRIRRLGLVIDA